MKHCARFIILLSASALTACAGQAPATSNMAARHEAVPATATTAAQSSDASGKEAFAIPYGYERVVKNGEEQFCRNDLVTGSRAQRRRVCLTRAQLQAQQSGAENMLRDVERQQGSTTIQCAPPHCGGVGGGTMPR